MTDSNQKLLSIHPRRLAKLPSPVLLNCWSVGSAIMMKTEKATGN